MPESWASDEEDNGHWVVSDHLRHVPQVPAHYVHSQGQFDRRAPGVQIDRRAPGGQLDRRVHEELEEASQDDSTVDEDHTMEDEETISIDDTSSVDVDVHQLEEVPVPVEQPVDEEDAEEQDPGDVREPVDPGDVQQPGVPYDFNIPDPLAGDSESDDEPDEVEQNNYDTLYKELTKEWIVAEIDHRVSKTCSDEFWRISNKYFHQLYLAKEREGRKKKVPQFRQARAAMYHNKVPPITMSIAYKHRQTGEISVVQGESTPVSQYPPDIYSKVYEAASVEVMKFLYVFHLSVSRFVRLLVCFYAHNFFPYQ